LQRERKPGWRIEVKTEEVLNTLCECGFKKKQRGSHPCRLSGMRICSLTSSFLMISPWFLMVSHFLPTPSLKKKYPTQKKTNMLLFIHAEGPLDTIDSSTSPN